MNKLNLIWVERWALRVLQRSPRLSLVIVKPTDGFFYSCSLDSTDPIANAMVETLMETSSHEPPDMMLERLYHAPSYGEFE